MSQNCIFCSIVAGKVDGNLLFQDEEVTAFRDNNPQAPTHILVIPNKHIASVNDASADDQGMLGKLLLTAANIAEEEKVTDDGYRLVLNTGDDGGQTVYHLHLHLLAGRQMSWPPG